MNKIRVKTTTTLGHELEAECRVHTMAELDDLAAKNTLFWEETVIRVWRDGDEVEIPGGLLEGEPAHILAARRRHLSPSLETAG